MADEVKFFMEKFWRQRDIFIVFLIFYFLPSVLVGAAFKYGGMKDIGARPLGMGCAYVSVSDEVDAVYWNPAGLSQNDIFKKITFMHTNLFGLEELPYSYLGIALPETEYGAFGLAGVFLGSLGHYAENLIILGYGKRVYSDPMWRVNLGVNLKYMSLSYSGRNKQGYGGDLGVLINLFIKPDSIISFGGVYRTNILNRNITTTRIGSSYRFKAFDRETLLSVDYELDTGSIHCGVELEIIRHLLDLRAGNSILRSGKYTTSFITAGVGFTIRTWRIDFVYLFTNENLPRSYRISVTTKF